MNAASRPMWSIHGPPKSRRHSTPISVKNRALKINISTGGGDYLSLARCLTSSNQRIDAETETLIPCQGGSFDVAHTLKADGFDSSEDGTGRQNLICQPINTQVATRHNKMGERTAFGIGEDGDPSFTLGANHHHAVAIQERALCENPNAGPDGVGVRDDGVAYTLEARQTPQAVAFQQNQQGELREGEVTGTLNTNFNPSGRNTPLARMGMAVRRLTPRECERLQGVPDDYTLIPINRGGGYAADGPRYKSLGNGFARPVVQWIGERIEMVLRK